MISVGVQNILATLTAITSAGSLTIANGAYANLSGSLSNAGTLELADGGTLSVPGSYTQSSSAFLDVQLDSGGSGQLAVTGTASLAAVP